MTIQMLQTVSPAIDHKHANLMKAAKALEANFLAEMLKVTAPSSSDSSFSGGVGEDQFTSFLHNEQAKIIVEAGGIGLAQHIFESLQSKEN